MKKILLFCFCLFALNFSNAATHIINWTFGYHGTTTIEIGDTVQWNFTGFHDVTSSGTPSFPSSGAAQSGGTYSHTFTALGSYYFLCVTHGAANMDGTIVVNVPLSVAENDAKTEFTIYPNPTKDVLQLSIPNVNTNVQIEIFDATSKQIYKSSGIEPTEINVTQLKSGIYFIKVTYDDYNIIKRFIKE